jgi:glucans biosynthesis protein C
MEPEGGALAGPRLVWVDWLKGIVVLGVVAYHAAQPFLLTTWIITDDEKSVFLSVLAGIGYLFAMPLMFLLAGTASMLAIARRSVRHYLTVRLLRLGLPLAVGLVLLSPFEAWLGHVSLGGTTPLPEYALTYLGSAEITFSPIWIGEVGHHLWFLAFLLAYVLLSLPVLAWLRDRPPPTLSRHAPSLIIGLPILALGLLQSPLRAAFPEYRDWADAVLWLAYFAAGALIALDRGLVPIVGRVGPWMVIPAGLLVVALAPAAISGELLRLEGEARLDLAGMAYAMARTAIGWCLVLASMALGIRWLDRNEPVARRVGEASLAFYVLHHPIVIIVAMAVVGAEIGVWPQFLTILAASLAVTGALYELVIRRSAALRAVFGVAAPGESELEGPMPVAVEGADRSAG